MEVGPRLLGPAFHVALVEADEHALVGFAELLLLFLVNDDEHGRHHLRLVLLVVRVDELLSLDSVAVLVHEVGEVALCHVGALLLREGGEVRLQLVHFVVVLLDFLFSTLDLLLDEVAKELEVLLLLEVNTVPLEVGKVLLDSHILVLVALSSQHLDLDSRFGVHLCTEVKVLLFDTLTGAIDLQLHLLEVVVQLHQLVEGPALEALLVDALGEWEHLAERATTTVVHDPLLDDFLDLVLIFNAVFAASDNIVSHNI